MDIPAPTISISVEMEAVDYGRPSADQLRQRRHSSVQNESEMVMSTSPKQNSYGATLLHPLVNSFTQFSFLKRSLSDLTKEEKEARGSQDDMALLTPPSQNNNFSRGLSIPGSRHEAMNIFAKGGFYKASVSSEILNRFASTPKLNIATPTIDQATPNVTLFGGSK